MAHFSSISAAICLLRKIFCQDNKFLFRNLFLHFLHPVRFALSWNFCYCDAIKFHSLLAKVLVKILLILSCGF